MWREQQLSNHGVFRAPQEGSATNICEQANRDADADTNADKLAAIPYNRAAAAVARLLEVT